MYRRVQIGMAAAIALFGQNWITICGALLSLISAALIAAFMITGLLGFTTSPYFGILAFMILPGVFVFGLLVVPVGVFWERRIGHGDRKKLGVGIFPTIDLNDAHTRGVIGVVGVVTAFNVFFISIVAYQGVHFMDSTKFCGSVCHVVMEPERVAHADSPHSRVGCVECHIGPGAPWFVKAKISGLRQVLAVAAHSYRRPIPTPVEALRPSRDTCEECHWPERFAGDTVRVYDRFGDDEANTKTSTALLMHIGGGAAAGTGIHNWHINPDKHTTYLAADEKRQEIVRVRVREKDGTVTEYVHEDAELLAKAEAHGEERVMDCIDCHNHPAHIFNPPGKAVDLAMAAGRIDVSLPFIKKTGVEVLTGTEAGEGERARVDDAVRAYYREKHSDIYDANADKIEAAAAELQAIYERNVFPKMGVTWGTYVTNIGHETSPGCFRCHNSSLVGKNGETITEDCNVCHTILAWDEEEPEILEQLGLAGGDDE